MSVELLYHIALSLKKLTVACFLLALFGLPFLRGFLAMTGFASMALAALKLALQ